MLLYKGVYFVAFLSFVAVINCYSYEESSEYEDNESVTTNLRRYEPDHYGKLNFINTVGVFEGLQNISILYV